MHAEPHADKGLPIIIDRKEYFATKPTMTGAELRHLPHPPIGPDRDLWLVISGPHDDERIGDDFAVHLKPGMHFYTAPATINPGSGRAS